MFGATFFISLKFSADSSTYTSSNGRLFAASKDFALTQYPQDLVE